VGLLTLLTIAGMSAFGGYRSGMYERARIESTSWPRLCKSSSTWG
jgi:hypothetical protein